MTGPRAAAIFLAIPALAGLVRGQAFNSATGNIYNLSPAPLNYGIARGSIFLMGGLPGAIRASQSVPLQTSLAGVTVDVTVGAVTTHAILYSIADGGVTAILPSSTPVGVGTVTATYTDSRGVALAPINVVESAFGLATGPPGSPSELAIAQDDSEGGQLLSQTAAANPGEYLTLWGTGLGPVSGDETQYQTPTDLTSIPIEVDIGGVSAVVTYHGRSTSPGLDQINVVVPAGVSGCYVSVVVTAGGVPSNLAAIPVAPSGRVCSDPALVPVTPSAYQGLVGLANVRVGVIGLTTLATTSVTAGPVVGDPASASFQQYTAQEFTDPSFSAQPSLGSRLVLGGARPPPAAFGASPLNAGSAIDLNGPEGLLALPVSYGSGSYQEPAGASPSIVPSAGGTFTFDNGSGGPDVGPFTATLTASLSPPLVWTNRATITAVNRARGQLVAWTGGAPGSYVYIFGYTYIYSATVSAGDQPSYTNFYCTAPLSAGQFTVPASVLQNLTPTGYENGIDPPTGNGSLYVTSRVVQPFAAPGLDLGLLLFTAGSGISVPFN